MDQSSKIDITDIDFGAMQDQETSAASAERSSNIQMLQDVKMNLSVELGRTQINIREILQLGEGSIVQLNKLAGEPVDIFINNKCVAKGEVVVVDENFGVRVTEIIGPEDRV